MSFSRTWLPAVTFALVALQLVRASEGNNADGDLYDDRRRMACVQALVTGIADTNLHLAVRPIADGMMMEYLVNTEDAHITRTSYPGGQLLTNYEQACNAAGGFFDVFSGTLDCVSQKDDRENTIIQVNSSQCFPPGPACSGYTELQLLLDGQSVSQNKCTAQIGVIDVPVSSHSSPSDSDVTTVSPNDGDATATTTSTATPTSAPDDDARRKACVHALASGFADTDLHLAVMPVADGMMMEYLVNTEDAQVTRTSYPGGQLLTNYEQACNAAGGFFDVFSGTLDCVSQKDGRENTIIQVNSAQCFPPGPACSGYTELQLLLDGQSVFENKCTAQIGVIDVPVSSHSLPPDRESSGTKRLLAGVQKGLIALMVAVTVVGIMMARRRRSQKQQIEYEARSTATLYQDQLGLVEDGEAELPRID